MENSEETWVYDDEALEHVNSTDSCICEASASLSIIPGEWGGQYKWCRECSRSFALMGDTVVSPDVLLLTNEQGLVEYQPEFSYELGLLISMSGYVEDYIETVPEKYGDVVLYAHDETLIGYLIYDRLDSDNPFLRAVGIADGYRFDGHGTAFLESWFETIDEDTLNVMAAEDTHPFYERLSFPVTFGV